MKGNWIASYSLWLEWGAETNKRAIGVVKQGAYGHYAEER